ncbi:uncharacterized protein AAGF69_017499 isoform 2-T2 [Amazona ochrocephala]
MVQTCVMSVARQQGMGEDCPQGDSLALRCRCARPRNPTEPFTRGTGRRQLPHRTQAAGGGGKSSSSGGSHLGVSVLMMPVDTGAWNENC